MLFSSLILILTACAIGFTSAAATPHALARWSSRHSSLQPLQKRASGQFTYFAVGMGACGKWNTADDFIVALNTPSWDGGSHCFQTITITINGQTTQAQIVDGVRAVALGTWISVSASSTTLEALRRKVLCTEPGITAVKSPLRLQPPNQRPLRLVLAPVQAAQALHLPPPLQNPPRAAVPVPVPLPLLPPVLTSLPLPPLEYLLKVCLRWLTLVDWWWLLVPLGDGLTDIA